jgi:hypothetical protein
LVLLLLAGCVITDHVQVTFGDDGEGLDGFLCKDKSGLYVLDRLEADAGVGVGPFGEDGGVVAPGGVGHASIVTDFLTLGGVPGCRASQLISWCRTHDCHAIDGTRTCTEVTLPTGVSTRLADGGVSAMDREALRAAVKSKLVELHGVPITQGAPQGFVMLRIIATAQGCDEALDSTRLVGGAYSCPVDFAAVEQDVYVGFDTLAGACEQGLRTISSQALTWQP